MTGAKGIATNGAIGRCAVTRCDAQSRAGRSGASKPLGAGEVVPDRSAKSAAPGSVLVASLFQVVMLYSSS